MGSACFFFDLKPQVAVLGDLNLDLIETYIAIRDHALAVRNAMSKLSTGKDSYYRIRSADASKMKPIERAARFIYLNRFCFNGLYRTNLQGRFNVPYGSPGTLPSLQELRLVSKALKSVDIRCGDFEETLCDVRNGDFVYMDPPFAVSNRRVFREYGPNSFEVNDLERFAAMLERFDKCGATFLVSYAICKEALTLFKKWDIRRVLTQRNISGFAKHRRRAVELLVSNYSPS